jgi:hypothetical protein
VFAVQAGASNYVVTGAAGSYYYSLGNSYSNATGAPYETKIGASVTQFQYARSYDPASGDLAGTYPAPTLAAITTAQSNVGSGTVIPRLSIDAKGRVTALSTVAMAALTTTQIAGLATTAPSALATAAVVGLSTFAARADHQHVFPTAAQVGALGATAAAGGDLAGNYPSPTLAAITTAQANVGSATAIPVISTDAKGRVTALSTVAFSALTTNQIAGLSTAAGAALTTTAIAGVSAFAARADHTHLFPTAAEVGAISTSGGTISVNSAGNALQITQTGTGNALVVEDSANPDFTPFVIRPTGDVGIGTSSPNAKLHVSGTIYLTQNISVGGANVGTSSVGAVTRVISISNAGNPPETPPPDGGVIYARADGALMYLSPSGTLSTIAPA